MYPDNIDTAFRKKVFEMTEKHGAATVLAMVVKAIETMPEAGYLDPPGKLPRAGNWSGPYTVFMGLIADVLKVGWRQQ